MTTPQFPHVLAGTQYAQDVLAGKIPACKWVKLACQRHLADKLKSGWKYKFDPAKANIVCTFAQRFHHVKGKWAARKEPIVLQPFQCFLLMSIFGWVHASGNKKGKRRFTRAMILLPRKNGKSLLAAIIGLFMFTADGEFGAEVFSGATTEKQALEVFGPARLMAERDTPFQQHYGVEVFKSNLHIGRNGSKFEPMIGKPGDGASPSCAIIDEYHEHLDDTMLNAMETGMLAREQPLLLIITTAGDNMAGPCYAMLKDLEKVLEGTVENDAFFGIVYTIDQTPYEFNGTQYPAVDWTTEAALIMANPNYGVSVDADILKHSQSEAIRNSRKQGIYQMKHANVWVGAREAFFNMKSWILGTKMVFDPERGQMRPIRPEDYKGFPLFVGMDLASTKDIAALILLFQLPAERFAVFGRFYLPETVIENGGNEQYQGWAKDGHLILTSGAMIDYQEIEADILDIHEKFGIKELAYDKTYAQMMTQRLGENRKMVCVEVPQNVMHLSAPMKHIDGLTLSGSIEHSGDPCFTWQMSNVVAKLDRNDNVYPNKERPEAKIDGPVGFMNAMSRAMIHRVKRSVYDDPNYQAVIITR